MSPTADRWGPVTWEQISHWGFKQGQHFNGMEVVEGRWKWVKRKWEMKISISKDNHFKLFFEGEWIHWMGNGGEFVMKEETFFLRWDYLTYLTLKMIQ